MTQQEEQLLSDLAQRVNGTQLQSKDAEAESLLENAFSRNPDAVYILCQTILVQQFALENAQKQLAAARTENDQLRAAGSSGEKHGSFLGNLFGLNKDDDRTPQSTGNPPAQPSGYQPVHNPGAPTGYQQPYPTPPGYTQPGYNTSVGQPYGSQPYPPQGNYPPGYTPAGYGNPAPYGAPAGYGYGAPGGIFGGGGGFLSGAMQTAAGVVAGEFAFRAIEDVFRGGFGGGRGFEGGGTEVVNNYYGDDGGSSLGNGDSFGDRLAAADGNPGGISTDIEDRRGESSNFLGSDGGDTTSAFADADPGYDRSDSSGFDDSSSDLSGGDDFSSGGDDNGF